MSASDEGVYRQMKILCLALRNRLLPCHAWTGLGNLIFVLFISTHLVTTRPEPICRSKPYRRHLHGAHVAAGRSTFASRSGPMGTKLAHVQFNYQDLTLHRECRLISYGITPYRVEN